MNVSSGLRHKQTGKKEDVQSKEDIKVIIKKINEFLKKFFDASLDNIAIYSIHVKEFFIDLATIKGQSSAMSEMFSKISNILQPFLKVVNPTLSHKASCCFEDQSDEIDFHKKQIALLQNKNAKLKRKINRLYEEIENYRVVSNRHMNFIYMLKKNNIDVQSLYGKGCENVEEKAYKKHQISEENPPTVEKKREVKYDQEVEKEKKYQQYPQIL